MMTVQQQLQEQVNALLGVGCRTLKLLPFGAYGTLMICLYAALMWFYASDLSGPRISREIFIWPLVLGMSVAYLGGYVQLFRADDDPQAVPLRHIVMLGIGVGLMALFIVPFHSTDVFGYINRGWQQAHYGMNPYLLVVDDIPNWKDDPMLTNHWVNNPSPYGFLFILITKLLCVLGGGNFVLTVMLFKAMNFLLYGLSAYLIYSCARLLTRNNKVVMKRTLYLFWLSPLIMMHHIANGHNDMVMGFFLALACWSLIFGKRTALLPLLTCAIFIKYAPIVTLPFALIYLIRKKDWGALFNGGAISILLLLTIAIPYIHDWQNLPFDKMARNATVTHASFHAMWYHLYLVLVKQVPFLTDFYQYKLQVRYVLKQILLGVFALYWSTQLWAFWKQSKSAENENTLTPMFWIETALRMMAVLILLASLKQYPWYLGMVFPLVFLLPEGALLRKVLITLSVTQLFYFTVLGQAHILNYLLMTLIPIVAVVMHHDAGEDSVNQNQFKALFFPNVVQSTSPQKDGD